MGNGIVPAEIAPWVGWMIFAVLLAIGEIVLPGIFLIWIAIAAAIAGGIAYATPLELPMQILIFAGMCLIATWAGRRWYVANPGVSDDPLLNDRAARLVGRQVTVIEAIVSGEGRVKLDDGTWSAMGPDAPVGARLTVIGVNGPTLSVAWPAA